MLEVPRDSTKRRLSAGTARPRLSVACLVWLISLLPPRLLYKCIPTAGHIVLRLSLLTCIALSLSLSCHTSSSRPQSHVTHCLFVPLQPYIAPFCDNTLQCPKLLLSRFFNHSLTSCSISYRLSTSSRDQARVQVRLRA